MSNPADASRPTVGGRIADALAASGARHFFLLTGGDNSFFMELEARGIAPVLARSERSAAFMADAYARLTRQAAFVYGQFGPGAAVVLSGLIDSGYGRSPVVAICSEVKTDVMNKFAYQELDQLSLFRSFTKYAARLEVPTRAVDVVQTAISMSMSGCPGPTYVGVPSDLLLADAPADGPKIVAPPTAVPVSRPRAATAELRRAVELIGAASRPVILAGAGCRVSGAYAEMHRLADRTGIPVLTTVGGKGVVRETERYAVGVAGRYARLSANRVLRDADLLIAVGTRLSDMATNRGRAFPPGVPLVHADIDPVAFGRNIAADVGVVADAASFLDDLDAALPDADFSSWCSVAAEITRSWTADRDALAASAVEPLTPVHAVVALRDVLSDTDILVSDTGYMAAWSAALFETRAAGPYYLRTAGSLGWAVPASLGAQLAVPESRVVALTGDGGLGYHISELETAVRYGLPVVIVVLNNGMLAFERHAQLYETGRWSRTLTDFSDADYAGVAAAFGAWSARVDTLDELRPVLSRALASGRPSLVDVRVAPESLPPVTNFDRDRPL